jgi:hypothetical protein
MCSIWQVIVEVLCGQQDGNYSQEQVVQCLIQAATTGLHEFAFTLSGSSNQDVFCVTHNLLFVFSDYAI